MKIKTTATFRLGDALGIYAIIIWLSVGVGPWWLGVVLVVGAAVINTLRDKATR